MASTRTSSPRRDAGSAHGSPLEKSAKTFRPTESFLGSMTGLEKQFLHASDFRPAVRFSAKPWKLESFTAIATGTYANRVNTSAFPGGGRDRICIVYILFLNDPKLSRINRSATSDGSVDAVMLSVCSIARTPMIASWRPLRALSVGASRTARERLPEDGAKSDYFWSQSLLDAAQCAAGTEATCCGFDGSLSTRCVKMKMALQLYRRGDCVR